MQTFNINERKRKKAIKIVVKANIKNLKGFPKFCRVFTLILRISAVLLGIANILYVCFLSEYAVDILFLIITFGIPYGFSYIPAIVYIIVAAGEYRLRRRETIACTDDSFVYSYHDERVGYLSDTVFGFHIVYDKIKRFEYDEKTKIITIYGNIVGDIYENGELKKSEEFNQITLLDVYDISIKKLLAENC